MDFKPGGGSAIQSLTRAGASRSESFACHGAGKRNAFEQAGKQIDVADEDQIIDGAGIGNHQPHGLGSKLFESPPFFLEVFDCVFPINAMSLEEAIQCDAAQAEHLA